MLVLFSAIVFVLFNVISKSVPCFEDEVLGAVFSVLAQLVVFQHTEGLVDAAFAADLPLCVTMI